MAHDKESSKAIHMKDDVWRRDEIESPCVKLCAVHPAARLCVGCLRTVDEIANWSRMTSDERREIMAALPSRKSRIAVRQHWKI